MDECKPLPPGSYAVDLYLSNAGCDYRGLSGSGCSRSLFERVDIVVQAAGVSALGTTGRGLHWFRFQLNLISSVHRVAHLNSSMCPGVAQVEL